MIAWWIGTYPEAHVSTRFNLQLLDNLVKTSIREGKNMGWRF